MNENSLDFKSCVNIAIENAKNRIKLLEEIDQKCIIEEYKEWIKEEFDYKSVLLFREDPII